MQLPLTSRRLLNSNKIMVLSLHEQVLSFACIWAISRGGGVILGIVGVIQGMYIMIIMIKIITKIDSNCNSDATNASARPKLA